MSTHDEANSIRGEIARGLAEIGSPLAELWCELSASGLLRDSGHLGAVLRDVVKELGRQDQRFGWPRTEGYLAGLGGRGGCSIASPVMSALEPLCRIAIEAGEETWAATLGEEVGEVANAPNPVSLAEEAVQVAAVAISIAMHAKEFYGLTAEMREPYYAGRQKEARR